MFVHSAVHSNQKETTVISVDKHIKNLIYNGILFNQNKKVLNDSSYIKLYKTYWIFDDLTSEVGDLRESPSSDSQGQLILKRCWND